ncbi:MAG: hypothetical protein QW040_03070 [Candidatus Aenigmatarchaeota archaeon]
MATTFNRYDGPSLNLPEVLACIVYLQEKNGIGPTEEEIVEEIHKSDYAGCEKDWVKNGVKRALEIGLRKGYIQHKDEDGTIRYYGKKIWEKS